MKKKFKLIAFDLDGTLLNYQMKISSYSRKKLFEIINKRIKCIIISSRTLVDIKRITAGIPFSYIAALNGSEIFNAKKNIVEKEDFIDKETVKKLLSDKKLLSLSKNLYAKENVYVDKFSKNIFIKFYQKRLNSILLINNFLYPSNYKNIYQFDIIADKRKNYENIFNYLSDKYSKYLSVKDAGFNFTILNNKTVDKGEALQYIAKKLKIKLSDTIVVGDSPADLPMFNKHCYKIAMKNGNRKIFSHADKITVFKHNQNGAVKEILSVIE